MIIKLDRKASPKNADQVVRTDAAGSMAGYESQQEHYGQTLPKKLHKHAI